ncbi:hypothetical protein AB0L71_22850 [Streptomyces sp. NPDC052052]|uniref:hypothetical protein n=1 Tax=Streptomyces sp. NPDC052052 TaxID=3154756 RepID=UPI00344355AB
MQRGLVHVLAWLLATGAAATLSWWGVHTVMAGTAYDPPRAVPIAAGARGARLPTEELSSSTQRPEAAPSPSPSPTGTAPRSAPATSASPSRQPSRTPAAGSPSPARSTARQGAVRNYATDGGRVVFELGDDWAKLVSATPAPGWSMQVWTNAAWIRVNFSRDDGTTVSVFCTWNDHAPQVDIV